MCKSIKSSCFFLSFLYKLLVFSFVFVFYCPVIVSAAQVTLEWDENSEEDLAGYRVFCRPEGHDYDYHNPVWEGTDNTCTIFEDVEDTRYFFVARAVNTSGMESANSNEVNYRNEDNENEVSYPNEDNEVVTVEVRVTTGSDDAEENASGGMYLTSTDLELVYDYNSNQTVGIRFNGVAIPQGATIVNAYVQFKVDETSPEATSLTIEGEDIDDAPTFDNSRWNISSRARTMADVSWSPVAWAKVGEAGPDQRTPDMSSIIQEIVDGSGWSSGNSLVVIITGTGERVAESYDCDQSGAPLLHVEYVFW